MNTPLPKVNTVVYYTRRDHETFVNIISHDGDKKKNRVSSLRENAFIRVARLLQPPYVYII